MAGTLGLRGSRLVAAGLCAWLSFGCASSVVATESVEVGQDPSPIVERFLTALEGDDPGAAFDTLMTHSKVDEAKPFEIQSVRGQLLQVLSLYGKPLDHELVSRQPFGSSVMHYVYVSRHRDIPLVWDFWLYRGEGPWQVLNFQFNDQLQGLR